MINLDVLYEIKDLLVLLIPTIIAPLVALRTNVWNQNYVTGKNKDQWLTVLRKCSYINKGFEEISTYNYDIYDKHSKILKGLLIAILIEVPVRLISLTYIDDKIFLGIIYIIEIMAILIYFKRYNSNISSKKLLDPQFTEEMRIIKKSRDVLFRYYLLVGILFGINICRLTNLYNFILGGTLSSLNVLSYVYFVAGIAISIAFLLHLKEIISSFYFKSITTIMDSNKHHFPFVIIKTQYDVVTGQLIDILEKDAITLNGDDRIKTVLWSKIELMEIKNTIPKIENQKV